MHWLRPRKSPIDLARYVTAATIKRSDGATASAGARCPSLAPERRGTMTSSEPVKIIFDTDMGAGPCVDVDDVGTLSRTVCRAL